MPWEAGESTDGWGVSERVVRERGLAGSCQRFRSLETSEWMRKSEVPKKTRCGENFQNSLLTIGNSEIKRVAFCFR